MGKIYHISQFNPALHEGGVAQFARHLKRAIPELELVFAEQVDWHNASGYFSGMFGPDDTVIADGYYGLGLAEKVERLIVVCHSTYFGWLRDWIINPPPGIKDYGWLEQAAKVQGRAYRDAHQIVAVSTSAQQELWECYKLDSEVIFNGVDLSKFTPSDVGRLPPLIAEVAGEDINKGSDIVAELRKETHIESLGFLGSKPDRWRKYDIAFIPSRHEGGPYAQLEAMAMNIKLVGYKAGYLKHDVPDNLVWSTYDYYPDTFRRLLDEATASLAGTRGWVRENASLDLFIEKWRGFLGYD